jgi:hypothetical protein
MEIFLIIYVIFASIVYLGFLGLVVHEVSSKIKSKTENPPKQFDYSKYDEDFKYLHYIINRERDIALNYILHPMEIQFDEKLTITDDDVNNVVSDVSEKVLGYLGDNYKTYLVDKYFTTLENLIVYIVEEVQTFLTSHAIVKNFDRAKRNLIKDRQISIFDMNEKNKTE